MTDYCLVKNGVVTKGPMELPKHWEGVFNLHLHPDPREFGWYPVVQLDKPEGFTVKDTYYELVNDVVEQKGTLEEIPPYVPPVPSEITETQFIRACVQLQIVSPEEGEGYLARGELPLVMSTALDKLDEPYRTDARLKAIGSSSFSRKDPIFDLLVVSKIATNEDIDNVFRLAGTLE